MIVQYLLAPSPAPDGGGKVTVPIPGVQVPSKDKTLDTTAHYGQILAPLIAILIVTAGVIWLARNLGGFVAELVKKASLVVGLVCIVGIILVVMMMRGK